MAGEVTSDDASKRRSGVRKVLHRELDLKTVTAIIAILGVAAFLHNYISDVEEQLRTEIKHEKAGLKGEIEAIRNEFNLKIRDLKTEVHDRITGEKGNISDRIAGLESNYRDRVGGMSSRLEIMTYRLDGLVDRSAKSTQ